MRVHGQLDPQGREHTQPHRARHAQHTQQQMGNFPTFRKNVRHLRLSIIKKIFYICSDPQSSGLGREIMRVFSPNYVRL
jgi:hypothetical protein